MMKIVKICSALAAAAAMSALADTVSVPAGTTVALDASADYSATTFSMAGGTLDLNGRTATVAGLTVASGVSNVWTNSGATDAVLNDASALAIGNAGLYVTGGRYVIANNFNIGENYGETSLLEVSGDDTRFTVNRTASPYFADRGQATIRIFGGETVFTGSLCVYAASQNKCSIEVCGGLLQMTDVLNCWRGTVDIAVSGGTLNPYYLRLGATGEGSGNHTLTVTDGTLIVPSEFTVFNGTASARTCTVNLNGGRAEVCYIRAKTPTGSGKTVFSADGGVLVPRAAQTDFLSGFQTARLGEAGLTLDTAGYATTVGQSFVRAEGASRGLFVKRGTGTLTLTGAVGDGVRVENRAGTLNANGTLGAAELLATEGTLVVNGTVGANATLTVAGGELILGADATVDPSVTAHVTGGTLRIRKSVTLAALRLDEHTRGNVVLENGAELTVTKDGETGGISGTFIHCTDDFTTTTDADGTVHLVKNTGAATSLEIRLDEENATSNVTEDVLFKANDTLTASVASGATLTLAGQTGHGALVKTGAGTLSISGTDNGFAGGVTLEAGRLVAASPWSLIGGTILQNAGTIDIAGGEATRMDTYQLDAGAASKAVVFKTAADVTFTNVVHVQGDLIKRGTGTLAIDRGGNGSSSETVLSRDEGVNAQSRTPMTFDDTTGTPPTTGFGGFNVAEGRVVLANGNYKFAGTTAMIGMPSSAPLAAPVSLFITNANVTTGHSGGNRFYVAGGLQVGDYGQEVSLGIVDSTFSGDSPFVVGGYDNGKATSPDMRVYVGVTNSTLTAWWTIPFNENTSGGKTYLQATNSCFYSSYGLKANGYVEMVFDDCVYAKNANLDATPGPYQDNGASGTGWSLFCGGSRVYADSFGGDGGYFRHTVRFDDAVWYVGTGVKMFNVAGYQTLYHVETVGAGVTIPVSGGVTSRHTMRLEGTGGIVKTGTGELFFDTRSVWNKKNASEENKYDATLGTDTWSFTGAADVREGTLSVTNGALASAVTPTVKIASGATWKLLGDMTVTGATVSGAGTVTGGTLAGLTITGVLTDAGAAGEVPTIASALSGRTYVDFGKACAACATLPKNVLVAKVSAANVSTWRAMNIGRSGVHATFRVADGEVRCDFARGFVLTFR